MLDMAPSECRSPAKVRGRSGPERVPQRGLTRKGRPPTFVRATQTARIVHVVPWCGRGGRAAL